MLRIIVDDREHAILSYLNEASTAAQIPYEVRRINVGDYAICVGDQIKIIIERKTWADLAASFRDGRKANVAKMISARQETGCFLMYMIEGAACPAFNATFGRIPLTNLRAHLDHLAIRDGIHIIYSRDIQYSSLRIFELAKNLRSLDKAPKVDKIQTIDTKPIEETCINSIEETDTNKITTIDINSIDETCINPIDKTDTSKVPINPESARSNIEVLQTVRHSPVNIQIQMLQCLPSIGSIAAPLLYEAKITIAQIVTLAPVAFMAKYESITFPNGRSMKKQIKKCCAPINAKTAAKILECIPGITRANAAALLEVIEFKDLFIDFDTNILANLHGTSKIGIAKAKKIYDACYGEKPYL